MLNLSPDLMYQAQSFGCNLQADFFLQFPDSRRAWGFMPFDVPARQGELVIIRIFYDQYHVFVANRDDDPACLGPKNKTENTHQDICDSEKYAVEPVGQSGHGK